MDQNNSQQTTPEASTRVVIQWWKSNSFIILMLLLATPIGIGLMWAYAPWRKKVKQGVTVLAVLAIVIPVIIVYGMIFSILYGKNGLYNNLKNLRSTPTISRRVTPSQQVPLEASVSALLQSADLNIQKASSISTHGKLSSADQQKMLDLIQKATADVRQATEAQPNQPETWLEMGKVYQHLVGFGQNADKFAEMGFQKATELDPHNPDYFFQLGQFEVQIKQYSKAEVAFLKAITLSPNNANYYYNLGNAFSLDGNVNGARNAYLQAKKIMSPQDPSQIKIDEAIKQLPR